MKIDRADLFDTSRDYFLFVCLAALLLMISLGREYAAYQSLVQFDDTEIEAVVLNQYVKTKKDKPYHVLKLRSVDGALFYMTEPLWLRDLTGYRVRVRIYTDSLTFLDYLRTFLAAGQVLSMPPMQETRFMVAERIRRQHEDAQSADLFAALFTATPLPQDVRGTLAAWGVSHLLAISGFHLGVLAALVFALFHYPYRWAQSRWFPWRHARRDLLVLGTVLGGGYVLFLGWVPSVMRAYAMMLIGLILYDRGIKIISFQTLAMTVVLLLALWPRLLFSVGLWLSVLGVFYIFLYVHHFKWKRPGVQMVGLHVWVYLMMLPWGVALFGTFSPWHPVSIVLTMMFSIVYPLVLLLHLMGAGEWLDPFVITALEFEVEAKTLSLHWSAIGGFALLSFAAIRWRLAAFALFVYAGAVFVKAIDQIA